MAERKKKTTEEVVVEKHFCKNCGKELSGDEVCDCTSKASPKLNININSNDLKTMGLNFLNTIKMMFVKPADTIDEEVSKHDLKTSFILLIALAIGCGLYVMGAFKSIVASINVFGGLNIGSIVKLPYFKIFVYALLINFIVSFVPITLAFLVNKLFKGNALDYKKCISLYATSMAPMIVTYLVMALLYALNILSGLGAIVGAVIMVACMFNFILGFVRLTKIKENRVAYALTTFTVLYIVVSIFATVMFMGSLLGDLTRDVGSYDSLYNELFDYLR